jgi:hypothetical protein
MLYAEWYLIIMTIIKITPSSCQAGNMDSSTIARAAVLWFHPLAFDIDILKNFDKN